jgi:ubiquinone/menaquinone biosynthesis C-methylase UbiE
MAERAHPDLPGFRDKLLGLKKSVYRKNLYRRYEFCNKYIKDKTVLDIPCGTGWGTSLLKGAKHIYALDIAQDAIEYARSHFSRGNISYEVGDMARLQFDDGLLDVIICLEGFEHVAEDVGMKFLSEAGRVLKQGGILIMTVPVLTNGKHSGNPHHIYEPSIENLQSSLHERFLFIHWDVVQGPESEIVYFVGKPR